MIKHFTNLASNSWKHRIVTHASVVLTDIFSRSLVCSFLALSRGALEKDATRNPLSALLLLSLKSHQLYDVFLIFTSQFHLFFYSLFHWTLVRFNPYTFIYTKTFSRRWMRFSTNPSQQNRLCK